MELRRLFLTACFFSGLLCGTLGPAAAATPEETANPRINPGDVVAITVYPATEYNREVTVQPDGKIELELLGSVPVKDLNAKQLQELLEIRYAKYVDNPKITIAIRHFAGRRVALIGEVHGAGFYPYRDGMKMLELVAMAGGLSDTAKASKVTILRDGQKNLRFNFQAVLDGDTSRDIVLQPGDTVFVPKTLLNKKSTWISNNILPYLTLFTLVASVVVLAKTQ